MKKRGNPKTDWKPIESEAYDPSPLCVKVLPGVRGRVMNIEGWRDRTRKFWDDLIKESESSSD